MSKFARFIIAIVALQSLDTVSAQAASTPSELVGTWTVMGSAPPSGKCPTGGVGFPVNVRSDELVAGDQTCKIIKLGRSDVLKEITNVRMRCTVSGGKSVDLVEGWILPSQGASPPTWTRLKAGSSATLWTRCEQ